MLKILNVREGFSRKDDGIPIRWLEEPMRGDQGEELRLKDSRGKVLTAEDTEKLLDDYYDECGWDRIPGIPTKQKLEELGLIEVLKDMEI